MSDGPIKTQVIPPTRPGDPRPHGLRVAVTQMRNGKEYGRIFDVTDVVTDDPNDPVLRVCRQMFEQDLRENGL